MTAPLVGYCGCCGAETPEPDDLWCRRCLPHIGTVGPIAHRTWFGQSGEPCPFQVPGVEP